MSETDDSAPFYGNSKHGIDQDGRFIVPARIREKLKGGFYVTLGVEDCLWLLPKAEFLKFVKSWGASDSLLDSDCRKLEWRFVGHAQELKPDGQGRVVLPRPLLQKVGVKEQDDRSYQVVVVGLPSRVELWDPTKWEKKNDELTEEAVQKVLNRRFSRAEQEVTAALEG